MNPDHSLTPSKAPCPPGWNGAEVTYFTMLHPLFGHNYCSLAELISTKTCYQVYQYAQLASGDALPGQGVGAGCIGKKKKRNMRSCDVWYFPDHMITMRCTLTPAGHGRNTIARFRLNWKALLATSTTISRVSTRASHVTTPARVSSLTTSVRSTVNAVWTALTVSPAVDVGLDPATQNTVLVSWLSGNVTLTFVTSVEQVLHHVASLHGHVTFVCRGGAGRGDSMCL